MDFPPIYDARIVAGTGVGGGSSTYDSAAFSTPSSPNLKGDWVKIVNPPPVAAVGAAISFRVRPTAPSARKYLIDMGMGTSGAIIPFCPNMLLQVGGAVQQGESFLMPVTIPKSTEIWARAQSQSSGAADIRLGIRYLTGGFQRPSPYGIAMTYGVTVDSTAGTLIDPGAVTDTKGAYVEVASSTIMPINYVIIFAGNRANAADNNLLFSLDLAVGPAGSEVNIVEEISYFKTSNDYMTPFAHAFPLTIPAGARISARAQSDGSDATDRLFEIAVMGVS